MPDGVAGPRGHDDNGVTSDLFISTFLNEPNLIGLVVVECLADDRAQWNRNSKDDR